MNNTSFQKITGWYGVCAILVAYALVSFGVFFPAHPVVLFLNISGALGLVLENAQQKDWPVVTLNSIWILIAVITLLKTFL